jgi:hypothetical protein
MVVIDAVEGNKTLTFLRGPKYHQRGANAHTFSLYDLLHALCDILVPITGVIVELPLISSITTVPVCPYGAVLDLRPAFLRTPPFRLFILLSTDLSVKRGKWAGFMKAGRDQGQHHVGCVGTVVIDIIKGNKTLSLMLGPDISPKTCKCRPSSPIGIFARIV